MTIKKVSKDERTQKSKAFLMAAQKVNAETKANDFRMTVSHKFTPPSYRPCVAALLLPASRDQTSKLAASGTFPVSAMSARGARRWSALVSEASHAERAAVQAETSAAVIRVFTYSASAGVGEAG